jgi:hypothetical protein
VSPILVRPVREQLEHDRIIRLLQAKCRRKYEAGINPGAEQNVPVGTGPTAVYPDVVLQSQERSRRLEGIIEVETGESVNHLEALAEWAHFSKLRAPFHLYVPSGMVDVARRLCDDNQITVHEIWSYHAVGEDVRFALVHRTREVPAAAPVSARRPQAPPPARAAAPARPAAPAAPRRKAAAPAAKRPARATKGVRRAAAPKKASATSRTQKRK